MADIELLHEKLNKLKNRNRRGVSPVKVGQLVDFLQSQIKGYDTIYIKAKDISKESIYFNDPRYVGVCLSILKDITPAKGVPVNVNKYSRSWRITSIPL
ncbi:MAG: hypothetical protein GWO20_04900 [Candidatus Korarchaeota archaeon]|nr:hypothetical protein [Candidatus Korarchaeota archaeon]NIW13115.1 hypothetical protein [Candidatus Thorarchaeota archaeon]